MILGFKMVESASVRAGFGAHRKRGLHCKYYTGPEYTFYWRFFFHCPSAVIITLFYYLREIHAKKCIISAIKLVKMVIFSL